MLSACGVSASNWQALPIDTRTIQDTTLAFAAHLAARDVGRVRLYDSILADQPILARGGGRAATERAHQMCTTRMSDDPRTGVVDRNCRVHGIANLYIGGSSVFATAGFQNPTYTIVQLALRLGDHLAETMPAAVAPAAGRRRGRLRPKGEPRDHRRYRDRQARRRGQAADPGRHDRGGLHGLGRGAADRRPYRKSIRIAAIAARTPSKAVAAYEAAGFEDPVMVDSAQGLARAIEAGRPAVTEDAMLVATSPHIDVLLDVTGAVEDAIAPVLAALEHGKHVLLMNPELDGTLGPLFKHKADKAGVVFTDVDGDQPGVSATSTASSRASGVRPVLLGNIKGLQDPYRNPTTQEGFAKRWGQNPYLVTSFADGTKVSFEMTVAANASGMTVAKRGMHGYTFEPGTPITQAAKRYDADEILAGPGIVDYVVGCEPGPGVWALGTIEHPRQRHYLNLYKLGEGPLYCFYTPYHLCHFEVPVTIARARCCRTPRSRPFGAPCVEVLAMAKRI